MFSKEKNPGELVVDEGTLILNNAFEKDEIHQEMKQYLLVFAVCSNKLNINDINCADTNEI